MKRVLLIEPLWIVSKLLEWKLKQQDFEVVSYRRLNQALEALPHYQENNAPDIIIVDYFPTKAAGREIIEAICKESAFALALLIGLVQAREDSGYKPQHKRYVEVEKPFAVQHLFELVASYLEGMENDEGEQK